MLIWSSKIGVCFGQQCAAIHIVKKICCIVAGMLCALNHCGCWPWRKAALKRGRSCNIRRMTPGLRCRALTAQIEQKDSAIADAQHNGSKVPQQLPGTAESARGGLPKDTPEDLDRLVKEWIAKVQLLIHCLQQRA
jgi:hypothetical protein